MLDAELRERIYRNHKAVSKSEFLTFGVILSIIGLPMILILLYIGLHARIRDLERCKQKLGQEIAALTLQNSQLKIKLRYLRSPERIERLALGMGMERADLVDFVPENPEIAALPENTDMSCVTRIALKEHSLFFRTSRAFQRWSRSRDIKREEF